MPCPAVGPCDSWLPLDLACCLVTGGGGQDPCIGGQPISQDLIDSASLSAAQLMWALTGRQFGICEVTIRPCRKSCNPCPDLPAFDANVGPGGVGPVLQNGQWYNLPPCSCQDSCSCTTVCSIPLPFPACAVTEVLVDGDIVPASGYRIDDFNRLVRVGAECWPSCQDLTLPDTEEGTWSVTVEYGRAVPELVLRATAEIACELIKACAGVPCRLPQRLQSITRQGVTVSFIDPQEFMANGRTGFYLADMAIQAYNPRGLQRRPAVYSPDVSKWSRTTG